MNTRTNNNPAYILATLGVYLGFVLVGVTPVFGHAATARVFDLAEEIERFNDPDKNPDLDDSIGDFASAFIEIYKITVLHAAKNATLQQSEQYSFDCALKTNPRGFFSQKCISMGIAFPSIHLGAWSQSIRQLHRSVLSVENQSQERMWIRFDFGESKTTLRMTLTLDDADEAAIYADALTNALQRRRSLEAYDLEQIVVKATVVYRQNAHVSIATHLPRSSIDHLFSAYSR